MPGINRISVCSYEKLITIIMAAQITAADDLGKSKLGMILRNSIKMDYMLSAGAAALTNIGLLGAIVATYLQNMRLIRSYFTGGLVLVACLFMVQNIVIVIFWSKLYVAGPSIGGIVDAAPYLFAINLAQSVGLSVLLWISRR